MKLKQGKGKIKVLRNDFKGNSTWSRLLLEEAKQFCLNTALHGYKFIVLPKRILLERVVWVVICLVSLISALTLLCVAWFNFQKNPLTSVTDSTHHPVWNYDFPAVTVCNLNKISRKKAYQLARNLTVTNGRNIDELAWDIRLLVQLINNDDPDISSVNYTRLSNLLKDNNIAVDDALRRLAPSCKEMLLRCRWKGEEIRCESIFEQVRTADGFCCSFNYFALRNHSFTGIFANKAPKSPMRVAACGYQTGLEVVVDNNPNDYFATHIPSIGYKVFVDNPHYFPDNNLQNVQVNMKSTNLVGVTPKMTYTTKAMGQLPVLERYCLFTNERVLASYDQYNYHNCMMECKMNMTIKFCGCMPYKYKHLEDGHQAVCSFEDLPCLAEYQPLIDSSLPGLNISMESYQGYATWEKTECSCIPDCNVIDYLVEKSSGVLSRVHSTNDLNLFGSLQIANQSVIRVFFNDLVAKKTRWDVAFNWHTLLAYYGGLLGLFVGFSFVSGLEIVYFFTVRLLADAAKIKRAQESPTKNQKRRQKRKVVVQPLTYQHLDPKQLTIPSDIEIQKYKMNSHFFN